MRIIQQATQAAKAARHSLAEQMWRGEGSKYADKLDKN